MDPQPTSPAVEALLIRREVVDKKLALMNALYDYDLITKTDQITDEEQAALVLQKEELKVHYKNISYEAVVALAYLNMRVSWAKDAGVTVEDIADTIPVKLISSLIADAKLKNDQEFIRTVYVKITTLLQSSRLPFSDVVIQAIDERQRELKGSSVRVIVDETNGTVVHDSEFTPLN